MNRRQFAFWLGFGLFSLGEKLGSSRLDVLASEVMHRAARQRWMLRRRGPWRWYQRDTLVDGRWKRTAMTRPLNVETGKRYKDHPNYVDEQLVPPEVRSPAPGRAAEEAEETDATPAGKPSAARRARHGRPPSKWLRSLDAEELRVWLRTIEPPEFGVSGMTFWKHLTRDHSFRAEKIEGLEEDELAKLHAAAHAGY